MKDAVRDLDRRRTTEHRHADRIARKISAITKKIRALANSEWEYLSAGDEAMLSSIATSLDLLERTRR
jgi:hypothetical protein